MSAYLGSLFLWPRFPLHTFSQGNTGAQQIAKQLSRQPRVRLMLVSRQVANHTSPEPFPNSWSWNLSLSNQHLTIAGSFSFNNFTKTIQEKLPSLMAFTISQGIEDWWGKVVNDSMKKTSREGFFHWRI